LGLPHSGKAIIVAVRSAAFGVCNAPFFLLVSIYIDSNGSVVEPENFSGSLVHATLGGITFRAGTG